MQSLCSRGAIAAVESALGVERALGACMVHATARLEVGIKQADGAEPLLLRVRHDVGAEQLQRLA